MSETATLEVLHKKRADLENQWTSKLQKHKTLEGDIKALEEKVQAQLQEKIKSEDQVLETLESKRKDLEKRLAELEKQQQTPQNLDEPTPETAENTEPTPEQPMEMTAAATDIDQGQNEEAKEKHKDEKKRRWM